MIQGLFSSPSSGLPLQDVLELANKYLDNASSASTLANALILCDNAKASIEDAENILNKRVDGQTQNDNIANAYQRHGKLLEEIGQYNKAQKSYSKAIQWGYVNVETLKIGSTRPTNPDDFIHQSLCPPTSLLTASNIAPAVYLGVSDVNNPTLIRQANTDDMNLAKSEGQMPVKRKDTVQVPQIIFSRDVAPSTAKFVLPDPSGRITSTSQLAYCLSLLHHSLDSKEGLDKAESDWSQAMDNDPGEKERLQTMATDVIRAFVRDELKRSDAVAEIAGLSAVLEQDDFRKLLEVFVDGVEQSVLLKVHLLDGLACLMKNAPQGNLDPDDLVKILEILSTRLKGTHQQSTQHSYLLAMTVSRVLDGMVDSQVEGLAHEELHEPLSQYLQGLQKSSDPRLVYQAAYAYQSLQHIPDDETILQAMMRRTGKVVKEISGVVSAVKALDINGFIDGLRHIEGGLVSAGKATVIVNDAYQNAKTLTESGQAFLESLKEGLSFSRKSAWYPALRGLDLLIQEGRLTEFETLIREAPCQQDPAFQWGVCQRLGELAANTVWDDDIRQCAITFLGEMYSDDAQWGHQAEVKQWILRILTVLAKSAESTVTNHAKRFLQSLKTDGDTNKRATCQAHLNGDENQYILQVASPSLHGSQLLDSVQNKPDIETPLRQLKYERLKGRVQGVYISPRAKANVNATVDFDLSSKVEEFLNSSKKVFLLLGDSGSGKSTFNSVLEAKLWDKYEKTNGPIPLFIHLPTIEKPEHNLIAERLRRANFTENQIRELKLYRKFILICDGYDESQQTRNLYTSNQLNQPGQWCVQMVISCRTEYTGVDYRHCFWPTDANNRGNSELFQEAVLTPFDKNQIQDYIDQYVSYSKPLWGTNDYLQALKKIPNLQDLVTNPFLLKIAVEVLPKLVDMRNNFSQIRITRVQLYDGFIAQWIERGKIRLNEMDLSSRDQEAFTILLGSGFNELGIEYLKDLATTIYDNQGGIPLVKYSDRRDRKTWKKAFFDNSDGKNLLREAIPLMRSGDQYRFMHRSILEYGLSLAVFDPQVHHEDTEPTPTSSRGGSAGSILSFEEQTSIEETAIAIEQKLLESPFGRRSIVKEPSISQFLVDRTQGHLVFKQQLHAVLERSKTDKTARTAATNAITVLVRAGVQFVGADLRGIKTPEADLSFGMFDSAQLDGADLRKANLYNIWLRKATLCGAQMTGVKFGELRLLHESGVVECCAYSQDGKMLAVGLMGGDINLYEPLNWVKIRKLAGHVERVKRLLFSDTSEQIASGSEDGEVRVWDVKTGTCVHTLHCLGQVLAIIKHLPGGYHIASKSQSNAVIGLWDVETGNCFQTLQGHTNDIICAAFSPSGGQIASGSGDRTVRLWSVGTNDCDRILEGHGNTVWSIVYSPDGGQIASGSVDKTIRLWNVASGSCIYTLHGHEGNILSLIYSPGGDQVASGCSDQTVRLWDVGTGDCIHTLHGHGCGVASVMYSPNRDQIASGGWDSTVRLWKTDTGNFTHDPQGHSASVFTVADSPKGDQFASGSSDNTVRLWDVETGKCLHTLQRHTVAIFNIAYSPKGDQIASGGSDGSMLLWNVETGSYVHTLEGHTSIIWVIKYSPNGGQIVSGSEDKTVRLWDVETANCVYVLQGHDDGVRSVVFSPKGDYIASGSQDKTVRLWDVKTGNCVTALQDHGGAINSVVFSPIGDQIASGSDDRTVRLWDVESGKCIHILEGHHEDIARVVYSPKGDQIASGSGDTTVRLWNVNTGNCVHTLQGHTRPIACVVYSLKGDKLASGSSDNTVRLWDVETGQFLVAITGFSGFVIGIAWQDTSEGQYLATGSWDKSVRRWQITKERDEYQVRLCWSSSYDGLVVAEANFNYVQGLSQDNWALLQQRGALIP